LDLGFGIGELLLDKKNIYVVLKKKVEIEEDIASFGLVCRAKIG